MVFVVIGVLVAMDLMNEDVKVPNWAYIFLVITAVVTNMITYAINKNSSRRSFY